VEEKNNIKRAMLFIAASIAAMLLLFFVGIPLFGRLTVFISDIRSGNKAITQNDTTPPAPPKFDPTPEFTNQQTITISGNSEAGATVILTFNSDKKEVITDKDGNFSFNLLLENGENNFSAMAIDTSENQSQNSKNHIITFDNKAPILEISSPADGASFFGSTQRQVSIQGTTDEGCQVTINERFVSVDEAGSFEYTTTLNDGDNSFNIKSKDQAGNSTEKTISLTFNP